MARNALFKQALKLIRATVLAEEKGWSNGELLEKFERARDRASSNWTRRELLRTGLQAAAFVPLAGLVARQAQAIENEKRALRDRVGSEPMVIVGAGLAGLVAAYRLQRAGVPVELYEGAGRLGGRIFTHDHFNAEGMFCELGGEAIDTGHKAVQKLCHELGLVVQDLRPFDKGVEHDIFHFGGKVLTQKEMIPLFRPLARHLARDIKAVFPDGDVHMVTYNDRRVARDAAVKFDRQSLREYLDSKTDVEKWVRDAIEVLYVCEYGLDAVEQSALNLLILIQPYQPAGEFELLGESDECLRVLGGNSRLVEKLETLIRKHKPGIHLQHKLVRIEDAGGKLVLTFDAEGGTRNKVVRANRAVLGIPFTTLRKVEGIEKLGLSPLKLKTIRELGYGMNTKFVLGFKEKYWRHGPHASRANILTDGKDQSFWETSKGQKGTHGIITNFLGGTRALEERDDRLASVLGELDSIYPGMKAGYDGSLALYDWGHSELNLGSYVCPHPGQYTTLWGAAGQPELGGRLYFTGEHTHVDGAGFINGAVQAGDQVARQILSRRRTVVDVFDRAAT